LDFGLRLDKNLPGLEQSQLLLFFPHGDPESLTKKTLEVPNGAPAVGRHFFGRQFQKIRI
jgi:hypothetical protein